ncbi:MAG: phosphoglycerate kinase [Parcubacteria group bacterium Gr01-1014_18]|nr:MAG: phosphoglycerate kinase [Parcubacteria group bacterium Greene0416_36]TSC79513.1 MAG: phosphoglycerate kinase [Parcubacteria group bacterium Gr01-1014_18]TSC97819.1 MAG: phosphoglycerate kinase [Parcubacteria group bacterium Greene1014_20]TSD05954.1 MAG: phosphoglycerate kinase [Parcubacteria group bacterium Greene0714_2]
MQSLKDIEVRGKRVLLRADMNVSIDPKNGQILSDFRICSALPTIRFLIDNGASVVLATHFGRPEGKKDPKYSVKFLIPVLEKLLEKKVHFASDCIGDEARGSAEKLKDGEVLLLENLRFHPGEEKNDEAFAKSLAKLADIYVNEAFSVCHRSHASVDAITKLLPSYAGLLLSREVEHLTRIKDHSESPFVLIVGGAKISDKIETIEALGKKADSILIGGALANTFLAAKGVPIGASLFQKEELDLAKMLMEKFCGKLWTPIDGAVWKCIGEKICVSEEVRNSNLLDLDPREKIYDLGSGTIEKYSLKLSHAKTVFWAGPMGFFEKKPFEKGTFAIIEAIVSGDAFSVAGGGETVTAVGWSGHMDDFSFVSSGGSAALEFVAGNRLPGLEALK